MASGRALPPLWLGLVVVVVVSMPQVQVQVQVLWLWLWLWPWVAEEVEEEANSTVAVGAPARRTVVWPPQVVAAAEDHPPEGAEEAEVAEEVEELERGSRAVAAERAPRNRRSSLAGSVHSGTLPCLRRGNSSRLVANMRSPATSFWRVSAGSITSSM